MPGAYSRDDSGLTAGRAHEGVVLRIPGHTGECDETAIVRTRMVDGADRVRPGHVFGVLVVAIPEVLSARHVPEATIASITAVAVSPAFWSFLVSPVLDVRFTRRWYSVITALLAALMTVWRCSICIASTCSSSA